jgi:hypothetical protein
MLPRYRSVAAFTAMLATLVLATDVQAADGSGFTARLVCSGCDHRAPGGEGAIQVLTPRTIHWAEGAPRGDAAVLRVRFAPEPEGWMLLAAGLSLVAVLHHSGAGRARRHRKSSAR